MDRQNSRRRRAPQAQESRRPEIPTAQTRQKKPWLNGLFALFLLLGLVYYLDLPFTFGIAPLGSSREATEEIRPSIGLRPEDHVFRLPRTQHLDWRVTSENRRPDGVLKNVYLINGKYSLAYTLWVD